MSEASSLGIEISPSRTPYLNSISIEQQPPYPGNLTLEKKIQSHVLWNAAAMVSDANRRMSDHLLNYGSAGVSQSNIVKKLYDDSVRIHKHLIDIEMENKTNVIPLRGR